jgi:hypothetical protein
MDEAALEAFRLRFRVTLLERLVLKTAFAAPVIARALSAKESRDVLVGWLESNSAVADQAYGEFFQDPALTALYSDEVRSLVDNMIAIVDQLYTDNPKLPSR